MARVKERDGGQGFPNGGIQPRTALTQVLPLGAGKSTGATAACSCACTPLPPAESRKSLRLLAKQKYQHAVLEIKHGLKVLCKSCDCEFCVCQGNGK